MHEQLNLLQGFRCALRQSYSTDIGHSRSHIMLTDSAEELDAQGGEDVEEKEEQQSEVADLRQRLHHRVQQSTH